jgi:hypothetical protein
MIYCTDKYLYRGADSVLLWFQKRDTIATALQPFDLSLETVVQCSVHYKTSAGAWSTFRILAIT